MREWLLARLRGMGGSSRRAMLPARANGGEAEGDEEKGGGSGGGGTTTPTHGIKRLPHPEEEGKEPQYTNGVTPASTAAASPEPLGAPSPVRMRRTDSDRRSFAESVHSVLSSIHHHKLPKWQYRLLVASVVVLATFLGILLIVSLIYGFGLQFPQITVLGSETLIPSGLMDAHGNVPLRSYLSFENPNIFRIYCKRSVVTIYTDPERTHVLGHAHVPALALHAHERNRTVVSEYAIKGIMSVPRGPDLVKRVLTGRPTLFYTTSVIGLQIKGLGFVPVNRKYMVQCKVLKLWPKPKPAANGTAAAITPGQGEEVEEENGSVADCHGRFV